MADGIIAGGKGVFEAIELLNKGPFGPQPPFTWAVDLEDCTVVASPDNPARAVVSVPIGEQATELTLTVTAADPDGKPLTKVAMVPILPREYEIDLQQIV